MYRPACPACNACCPVRIPVALFAPSRSQRRVAARNRDLRLTIAGTDVTDELYDLFLRYQHTRHADSEMAHMTRADLAAMLQEGAVGTQIYELRAPSGELWGGIIVDDVQDGLSAVYSFFTPNEPHRSLGVQLVLSLVDEAVRQNKPYVYLGYWIAAARKMAYKNRFRPLQILGSNGWDFATN